MGVGVGERQRQRDRTERDWRYKGGSRLSLEVMKMQILPCDPPLTWGSLQWPGLPQSLLGVAPSPLTCVCTAKSTSSFSKPYSLKVWFNWQFGITISSAEIHHQLCQQYHSKSNHCIQQNIKIIIFIWPVQELFYFHSNHNLSIHP